MNQLVSELVKAKKRGVDIKVLLERSDYNDRLNKYNTKTRNRLKRKKIKVRFDSSLKQTHSKIVIIDGTWTFIGSHNLSYSALKRNNEFSVLIRSVAIAKRATRFLDGIE